MTLAKTAPADPPEVDAMKEALADFVKVAHRTAKGVKEAQRKLRKSIRPPTVNKETGVPDPDDSQQISTLR